ncbi:MAG: GNAT family N-acetyltransferase [Sandaracinaceae bacterium]|nr:GNAT family N-acetyltransferase [Sandaracinaceae bacterium]
MQIRAATADDAEVILRFIRELAAYEREPDAVEVDRATLAAQLSEPSPPFECLIAEDGEPVGFALYFGTYSTWRGRRGIHLEDLWVTPRARGRGVGRALLRRLAAIACERGCARLEWAVLDWNELAMSFYRGLGATPMDEWTTWRLSDGPLAALAAER